MQAGRPQEPLTAISPISSGGVLTEPPKGTQRASAPAARTAPQHDDQVAGDRELAQRLGELAAAIARPEAPTEKTPETGLTPECRPATSVT